MKKKKNIMYVINSLEHGGAELGFELLLNNHLFDNANLFLVCLGESNSDLENRVSKFPDINFHILDKSQVKNKKIMTYLSRLGKLIRQVSPEIIITSLSQSVMVVRFLRLFMSFNHITFEHNTSFKNEFVKKIIKYSDRLTDSFWCDSTATEKALYERNPSAKALIVPLFFIEKKNKISVQNKIIRKPIELITVGRLMPQKNYPDLFFLIKKLNDTGINARLSIYGEGDCKTDLLNLIDQMDMHNAILFKGFVKHWIKEADKYDIFILMSDYEGLSIATLEAMSAGLPCVVKPVGELIKHMDNGERGLLISSVDEALASIKILVSDSILRLKIIYNSISYVEQEYSEDKFFVGIENARIKLGLEK